MSVENPQFQPKIPEVITEPEPQIETFYVAGALTNNN